MLARIDIGLHTGQLSLGMRSSSSPSDSPCSRARRWRRSAGVLVEPGMATGAIVIRRELLRLRDDRRQALGRGVLLRKAPRRRSWPTAACRSH